MMPHHPYPVEMSNPPKLYMMTKINFTIIKKRATTHFLIVLSSKDADHQVIIRKQKAQFLLQQIAIS